MLTLYYHGYDHHRLKESAARNPNALHGPEKDKPGIDLTERPLRVSSYQTALKVELDEDLVLPFEWVQENDWFWREFRVPAAMLNAALGLSGESDAARNGEAPDVPPSGNAP